MRVRAQPVLGREMTQHPSARLEAGELHQLRWLAGIIDFDLNRHPVLAVTVIERDLMRVRHRVSSAWVPLTVAPDRRQHYRPRV